MPSLPRSVRVFLGCPDPEWENRDGEQNEFPRIWGVSDLLQHLDMQGWMDPLLAELSEHCPSLTSSAQLGRSPLTGIKQLPSTGRAGRSIWRATSPLQGGFSVWWWRSSEGYQPFVRGIFYVVVKIFPVIPVLFFPSIVISSCWSLFSSTALCLKGLY